VGHCHMGLDHAHVQQIPQGCRGSAPRMSTYAPSTILSFASLDICICPVEYDDSLAQGKHNEKGDNCIYKK
jgi:hypothetical protein